MKSSCNAGFLTRQAVEFLHSFLGSSRLKGNSNPRQVNWHVRVDEHSPEMTISDDQIVRCSFDDPMKILDRQYVPFSAPPWGEDLIIEEDEI